MLEEIISSKHVGNPAEYMELEEKTLEQKAIINELKTKNQELDKEVGAKNREQKSLREKIKEYEQNEAKASKQHDKIRKQKAALEDAKTRLKMVLEENAELKGKVKELGKVEVKKELDTSQNPMLDQLRIDLERLKKEKDDMKRRAEESDRRVQEKDREMREERSQAKYKDEENTLKMFEEKEKMNQRIVRCKRG